MIICGIAGVNIDTDNLVKENEIRKEYFSRKINVLHSDERINCDWSKVKKLFNKMISGIQE